MNEISVTGSFVNDMIEGQGELKCGTAIYAGEFKKGLISGKGTLTWSTNGLQLKFNGIFDSLTCISGKFEIKAKN